MKSILISKCLLGDLVRYDGGHCLLSPNDIKTLKSHFDLVPVCPEVMAGMSIPRAPIEYKNNRIINKNDEDLTSLFSPVMDELISLINKNNIEYAILKDESPSCGSTEIYDGSFSGNKIKGEGIITKFLRALGVEVISEKNLSSFFLSISDND